MTTQEAIRYIENIGWSKTRLGLSRTRQLLELLGNPQKQLKFIHTAGSNGKGSTCAMFDAILRAAGYRCGLYTSPYIEDFCERIRVNGENIPGERLAEITERVRVCAESMEDHPSEFELVTAIAMIYFLEEHCDIVVLEVGMGGEMDSTNVIDAPELACITNIGLEHTEYLGSTLEEIARTKAGIIKPGSRCVIYDGDPVVTACVESVCRDRGVSCVCTDFSRLKPESEDLSGQRFLWKEADGSFTGYTIPLLGEHQLHNAALVLTGTQILREAGWKISREAVLQGLSEVWWPARLEVLSTDPVVILDGGHNPQCAQALTDSLKELIPGQKVVFLAGVLRDKDYETIVDYMIPWAREFVCVTPVSTRALTGREFSEFIRSKGVPARHCDDIGSGLETALKIVGRDGVLVIFGSLYLAGGARKVFPSVYRNYLRREGIRARSEMDPEEVRRKSELIARQILESPEYQAADLILLYCALPGEVHLDVLAEQAEKDGKEVAWPRCMDQEHMEAFIPESEDSFVQGTFGVMEPDPETSETVDPERIDLVICPGTVFDEKCDRIGMGAGYFDRFLTRCSHARIVGAAFEAQVVERIPAQPWDRPMEKVYTEERMISRHE